MSRRQVCLSLRRHGEETIYRGAEAGSRTAVQSITGDLKHGRVWHVRRPTDMARHGEARGIRFKASKLHLSVYRAFDRKLAVVVRVEDLLRIIGMNMLELCFPELKKRGLTKHMWEELVAGAARERSNPFRLFESQRGAAWHAGDAGTVWGGEIELFMACGGFCRIH